MKRFRSIFVAFILLAALMIASLTAVFAEGGDGTGGGTGDGDGTGNAEPTLLNSSVKDYQTDIELNPTIQLTFSKNICNVKVISNNKTCFHLTDSDGKPVKIKLIFPDDQVQSAIKDCVFIIPEEDLTPNSNYRIAVDSTLMAKNGNSIDNAHQISFTTGDKRTGEINKMLESLGSNIQEFQTAEPENENSVAITKDLLPATEDKSIDTAKIIKIAIIILLVLIASFTLIVILKSRRKSKKTQ